MTLLHDSLTLRMLLPTILGCACAGTGSGRDVVEDVPSSPWALCLARGRCEMTGRWSVTRNPDIVLVREPLWPCLQGEGFHACARRFIDHELSPVHGELVLEREWSDGSRMRLAFFRQRVNGVPVQGGGVVVARELGGGIVSASVNAATGPFPPPGAIMPVKDVVAKLKGEVVGQPGLVFLDPDVLSPWDRGSPAVLAFRVEVLEGGGDRLLFLRASDGALLADRPLSWNAPWQYQCGKGQGVKAVTPMFVEHDCALKTGNDGPQIGPGVSAFLAMAKRFEALPGSLADLASSAVASIKILTRDKAETWSGGKLPALDLACDGPGAFLPRQRVVLLRSSDALPHELAHAWLMGRPESAGLASWLEPAAVQEGAAGVLAALAVAWRTDAGTPGLDSALHAPAMLSYGDLEGLCTPGTDAGDSPSRSCHREWSRLLPSVFARLVDAAGIDSAALIFGRAISNRIDPRGASFGSLATAMLEGCLDSVEEGVIAGAMDCILAARVLAEAGLPVPEVAFGPGVEVSNGVDDDGDGKTDNLAADLGHACGQWTSDQGECRAGRLAAAPGGKGCLCEDGVGPAAEGAACDGRDNDCDGETDEGLACCDQGSTRPCGKPAIGVCEAGLDPCSPATSTWSGECIVGVDLASFQEVEDRCDGLDNDCNGETDEGIEGCCAPGTIQPCGLAPGTCKPAGVQECSEKGSWGECSSKTMAEDTTCDGKDDDCDGETDEEWSLPEGACGNGGGEDCKKTPACKDGKVACLSPPHLDVELCNGIDDDCDGETDETDGMAWEAQVPGTWKDLAGTTVCHVADGCPGNEPVQGTGPCSVGVPLCKSGVLCCVQTVFPGPEKCNGIDDDCNGLVDDMPGGCNLGVSVQGRALKPGSEPKIEIGKPVRPDGQPFAGYHSAVFPRFWVKPAGRVLGFRACMGPYCPVDQGEPQPWPEAVEAWESPEIKTVTYFAANTTKTLSWEPEDKKPIVGLQFVAIGYSPPVFMERYGGRDARAAACSPPAWFGPAATGPPSAVPLYEGLTGLAVLGWNLLSSKTGEGLAGFAHHPWTPSGPMDPLSCQQVTGGACGAFSCEADEGMLYNWSGDAPSYASLPAAIPAGFVTRIDSTTADGKGQWQLAGLWAPPACVEVGVVVLQCGYEGTACVDHGTLVAKKEGAKRAILVSFLRLHDGPPGASVVTRVDGAGAPLAAGIKDICKSGGKACAEALVNETLMGSAGGTLPDDAAILRQDAKSNHAGDKVEVYLAVRPETGGLPFPGVHNPHARAMAVMIEF